MTEHAMHDSQSEFTDGGYVPEGASASSGPALICRRLGYGSALQEVLDRISGADAMSSASDEALWELCVEMRAEMARLSAAKSETESLSEGQSAETMNQVSPCDLSCDHSVFAIVPL